MINRSSYYLFIQVLISPALDPSIELTNGGRIRILSKMRSFSNGIQVRPFQSADFDAVINLWNECGLVMPWNDPGKDIRRKLNVQPEMFLVGCLDNRIVATVMAGYEGHRGWINYLAVEPQHQYTGIGRRMMEAAESKLRAAGCPKINLQVRRSNHAVIEFYERVGFKKDNVISLGKRLEPDE